ncbi:hypothetical protein DEU52_13051 [Ensifer adhaerens]|jgi:hypothetical protein|nr:hypothetical protein DEU52_13051 [Ensifer adhaerens]
MKSLDEKLLIILGAFHSVRYGVSPSVSRGAAENHAKKQGLAGSEYSQTLEVAIGSGLIGLSSDSSLSIRAAGRTRLGKR